MDTQTYFHTKLEREADKKEEREPLVVNCTGAVAEEVPFFQQVCTEGLLLSVYLRRAASGRNPAFNSGRCDPF